MSEDLPTGWEVAPLAAITSKLVDGSHNPPQKQDMGKPMLSAININENRISLSPCRFITEEAFDLEDKRTNVKPGNVLLTIVGAIGRTAVVPENATPFTLQRSVAVLDPIEVDPRFLMYQLEGPQTFNFFKENARGTAQKGIYLKTLGTTKIAIPPLKEQKRIVAKIEELFSELDKGIENLKTAREQLKIYRQAVLKHAFEGKLTADWREKNKDKLESADELLERIKQERDAAYQQQLEEWKAAVKAWEQNGKKDAKPTKPSKYKPLPAIKNEELSVLPVLPEDWLYVRLAEIARVGSGMSVSKERKLENPIQVPYLRVANVQRGELILDEIRTMPIEKNKLADLALKKWDVLFNEGGDRDKLGRGWVWEEQVKPCITQNHVFRATSYLGGEFHAKFISHWGNTFGRDYFEKGGKQTTNLASINKTVLSMFPVPLPSLEEQVMVIQKLDDTMSLIDSLEQELKNGIEKSGALRQSILKRAFSGKLVAQDPKDEPASVLLERIKHEKNGTQKRKKKVA